MSKNELCRGLWDTVRDSAALELVSDIGEVGLDAIVDGPLKEVPVFGTALKVWKAGAQVRDQVFITKLGKFLNSLEHGDREAVREFADSADTDQELRARIGAKILLAIDRLDDVEKPELLARAFVSLARGDIAFSRFSEFNLAIDRCLLSDLKNLKDTMRTLFFEPAVATRLSSCGLIELHGVPAIRVEGDIGNNYHMTRLGRDFVHELLGGINEDEL